MPRTLFVETYRPSFPEKGSRVRVHSEKNFNRDQLSPDMTSVFRVENVESNAEAFALIAESAAGLKVSVKKIY